MIDAHQSAALFTWHNTIFLPEDCFYVSAIDPCMTIRTPLRFAYTILRECKEEQSHTEKDKKNVQDIQLIAKEDSDKDKPKRENIVSPLCFFHLCTTFDEFGPFSLL